MHQPFSSFSLSGRCALLTGATGYLGASMAYALAKAGAKVLVNSRSREKAQSLVAQLLAEGYDAEPLVFDLASPEQVYEAISTLNGQHLHILINNAYEGQWGTLESADAFQYQDSYALLAEDGDLPTPESGSAAPKNGPATIGGANSGDETLVEPPKDAQSGPS